MTDRLLLSRLLIPAILSAVGLFVTQAWYQKSKPSKSQRKVQSETIAILESHSDLIERRPTTRIIWEPIRTGESLYSGEAVRTGPKASGKISFVKMGMSFGLEPDSLIIIEEQAGNLQLNLVNGGVFVRNDASSGVSKAIQPIIKAGNKKIELNQAKSSAITLSVAESGGANISVTKGDVKLADENGKTTQIGEGASKNLSLNSQIETIDASGPSAGTSIPLTGNNDSLVIGWSRAPRGSTVFLETGSTREKLQRLTPGVSADTGKTSAPLPTGYFFWQLVAERAGKVVGLSPPVFNQSIVLESPKLIKNSRGEQIAIQKGSQKTDVLLSWSQPSGAEAITVSIATDPELKNLVQTKTFKGETEASIPLQEARRYYWNATATWPGISQKVTSKIGSFSLGDENKAAAIPETQLEATRTEPEKEPELLAPPKLIVDSAVLQAGERGNIDLRWRAVPGAAKYIVQINGSKTKYKKELTRTNLKITGLMPGTHDVIVTAVDAKGRLGKKALPTKLEVPDISAIEAPTVKGLKVR